MKKKQKQAEAEVQKNEELVEEKPVSKKRRVLNAIINWVLVVAVILAALATYVSYVSTSGNGVPSILGIRLFSIQTESMYPTLKPGDLIVGKGTDTKSLQVGDIITYWTVIEGERVLNTHRISEIYDGGGYLIFSTKGDNNQIADPLTVHESEIVGKYAFRIGGVGKVFDYLQTSTGFLIVVVVPVFIFFLYYLVQFFRVLFEYQNVKNRIKYEEERGKTEDLIARQEELQKEQEKVKTKSREEIEAEIREKLRAELLAEMTKAKGEEPKAEEKPAEEPKAEEKPAEEPKAEEKPAEEPKAEEKPAEEPKAKAKPAEEPKAEENPAEEPKAEEKPAEEPKAEEKPAEEPKAKAKPAEEERTEKDASVAE